MLGYRHYADDLVDYFVKKSIDNGIDILRIFDALNDVRNLKQLSIPQRNTAVMFRLLFLTQQVLFLILIITVIMQNSFENAGADSICIKDMAGLFDTVRNL